MLLFFWITETTIKLILSYNWFLYFLHYIFSSNTKACLAILFLFYVGFYHILALFTGEILNKLKYIQL